MDKYMPIKRFLKGNLTGRTSAEIKEEFPDEWEEVIAMAELKTNGFYRELYHSQYWGQYYRYKAN